MTSLSDWAETVFLWAFFGGYVGMFIWLLIKMVRESKEED